MYEGVSILVSSRSRELDWRVPHAIHLHLCMYMYMYLCTAYVCSDMC